MNHPNVPDAFRLVDWRYRRALALLESRKRPSRKWDDEWTRRSLRFLKALRRCGDDEDRRRLSLRMPTLYKVHALYTADPPRLRWAVEARLLAGEPFDSIASKCGLTCEAVKVFQQVYFDIADKLGSPDYVACQIIGHKLQQGLTEQDTDIYWKIVAYGGGAELLDVVISGVGNQAAAERLDRFLAADTRSTLLRKLAIAARALPINAETAQKALELFGHLSAADAGGSATAPFTIDVANIIAEVMRTSVAAEAQLSVPGALPSLLASEPRAA